MTSICGIWVYVGRSDSIWWRGSLYILGLLLLLDDVVDVFSLQLNIPKKARCENCRSLIIKPVGIIMSPIFGHIIIKSSENERGALGDTRIPNHYSNLLPKPAPNPDSLSRPNSCTKHGINYCTTIDPTKLIRIALSLPPVWQPTHSVW